MLALINLLCFGILESFDHQMIIWCISLSVKRYTLLYGLTKEL